MIVYHGSNSNFKKLRISKTLVQHRTTLENEGLGIYFSTDKEVARSYGKYIYTLAIDDRYIQDFRKIATCKRYINEIAKEIYKETEINILSMFDVNGLLYRMQLGGQCIYETGKEIYALLDSTEEWYTSIPQYKRDKISRMLNAHDKELKAYMFSYHIPNIGVIKDLNVVQIVNKEDSY